MSSEPSPTAANGRDPAGRFAPGNGFARGNPFARKVARFRSAVLRAVKPGDVVRIVVALVREAAGGDVAAAKLVMQYTLGDPVQHDVLSMIEELRQTVAELESWANSHGR